MTLNGQTPRTEKITVDRFISYQENPRQRNTARRAEKAANGHLKTLKAPHVIVHIAELPSGERIKIDGHTRAFLWEAGKLERPPVLTAEIFPIHNREEASELYMMFDSPDAVETAKDRIHGAYRQAGMSPTSGLLKHGGVSVAFASIYGTGVKKEHIYSHVLQWKPELELIDSKGYGHEELPGSFIAAMLCTVSDYGADAFRFWDAYDAKSGTKVGREADGVHEAERLLVQRRDRRQMTGRANIHDLAGRVVACVDAYLSGRTFTMGAKGVNFPEYARKILARKEA